MMDIAAEKAASKAKADPKKPRALGVERRPGRPKGSTNHSKATVTFTPELLRIKAILTALLQLITPVLSITYLVLDGHFGDHVKPRRKHRIWRWISGICSWCAACAILEKAIGIRQIGDKLIYSNSSVKC